jgi:DNA-binding CsgD family transcriptional regulator
VLFSIGIVKLNKLLFFSIGSLVMGTFLKKKDKQILQLEKLRKITKMNSTSFMILREILDSQDEDALIYDVNTNQILLANKKACESLGFTINEIVNTHLDIIISKNFNPIVFNEAKEKTSEELRQFITKCGYSFIAGTKNKKISIQNKKYQLISFRNLSKLAEISATDKNADTGYIKFTERLFEINQQVTNVREGMFFKNMVYSLANAFEVSWVMICLLSSSGNKAKVLSLWDKTKFHSELIYKLKGTPCGKVKETKGPFYCEKYLEKLFPEDLLAHQWGVESYLGIPIMSNTGKTLGVLAIMDNRPIEHKKHIEYLATMNFFSDRCAKEIILNSLDNTILKKESSKNALKLNPNYQSLSKREAEVLKYVCDGLNSASIAKKIVVSLPTVKFHLKNIYKKLGINGRNGLLKFVSNLA